MRITSVREEICGKEKHILYDLSRPFLPKHVETKVNQTILASVEYDYDFTGLIINENNSGCETSCEYDSRGFIVKKTLKTGTEDPDVIYHYSYNDQGQCIRQAGPEGSSEYEYDILGNNLTERNYRPDGRLLAAIYRAYNSNNQLLWEQGPNPEHVTFFDYNDQGLVKLTKQSLTQVREGDEKIETFGFGYTLYDYDEAGNLILKTNSLGNTVYQEYDSLGRISSTTKSDEKFQFEYEPGGLLAKTISPLKAVFQREYTTNGLLKKEINHDGTENTYLYDFLGRPIYEKKNGIEWEISYDDVARTVTRNHKKTGISETQCFDSKGNNICSIDEEGNRWEKTYDSLYRIKSKRDPDGQLTTWSYQDNIVTCILPNSEKIIHRYENGVLVESTILNAYEEVIGHTLTQYFPELSMEQEAREGNVKTTWFNSLGQPIKVQNGILKTICHYDALGHCIKLVDGEGNVTEQQFDSCERIVKKTLPSGAEITYDYDRDSHLVGCDLPGGNQWRALYSLSGHKIEEKVISNWESTQCWQYSYVDGYLRDAVDPLERVHHYQYDAFGRIVEESVDRSRRSFTYNNSGRMLTAEEKGEDYQSRVERKYDSCGRIAEEKIYLDSTLIQTSHQSWTPDRRQLQIGEHQRDFLYELGRIREISTNGKVITYDYATNGSLTRKKFPGLSIETKYNDFLQPGSVQVHVRGRIFEETLTWDKIGKLSSLTSNWPQRTIENNFSYHECGYLKNHNQEGYEFDFNGVGPGIRTSSPTSKISEEGLNPYGQVTQELAENGVIEIIYDSMGQVTEKKNDAITTSFKWDPWGRLVKVESGKKRWKTFYDPLNRRIKTVWTEPNRDPVNTISYYDPEEEFLELGFNNGQETFWKLYGPHSCDAIMNSSGQMAVLIHDVLGNLQGVEHEGQIHWNEEISTPYGPLTYPETNHLDLIDIAKSFSWRNRRVDPTGLIWFGARHYDPIGGRFLSVDPIGYPISLDLYAYANGDPINHVDMDGRFSSAVYQTAKPVIAYTLGNPRVQGGLRAFGGFGEAYIGGSLAMATCYTGIGFAGGMALMGHGLDNMNAGFSQLISGVSRDPATVQLLRSAGMSHQNSHLANDAIGLFGSMGLMAYTKSIPAIQTFKTNAVRIDKISVENPYVNLASPKRTNHILHGEGNGRGGHLYPGGKGKTPFPKDWDEDKIMHYVSDIATDPSLSWVQREGRLGALFTKDGKPVRFEIYGIREDIRIKVVVEPAGEGIITSFPN